MITPNTMAFAAVLSVSALLSCTSFELLMSCYLSIVMLVNTRRKNVDAK